MCWQCFGTFSGLRLNAAKTYVLVKQSVGEPPTSVIAFAVKESLRYVGFLPGHLSSPRPYASLRPGRSDVVVVLTMLPRCL